MTTHDRLDRNMTARRAFARDRNVAVGLLNAALEMEKAQISESSNQGTIINIENSPKSVSNATATAKVTLNGSSEQLRRSTAEATGITSEERGQAISAVPDDEMEITLDNIEKLPIHRDESTTTPNWHRRLDRCQCPSVT